MAYNASMYNVAPTGQPMQQMYQNIPAMPMVQQNTVPQVNYQTPYMQSPSLSVAYTQGEVGARSYLVAPNNTVVLLDSDTIDTTNPIIYIKTTGPDGKPLPMRRIVGESSYPNEHGMFITPQVENIQPQIDLSDYSTKEDLQNKISTLTDRINSLENIISDMGVNISNIDNRFSNMFNAVNTVNNGNNNNGNSSNRSNNSNNNRKGN